MIKLNRFRFGPGYYQTAGTVIDLDPAEERALVEEGAAVVVETETAIIAPPENAARPSPPSKPTTKRKGKRR